MNRIVIDTNVAIAANGRDTHASYRCQLACTELLELVANNKDKRKIILDSGGEIIDEYSKHLHYKGQPGIGDYFFKFLHDNLYLNEKVHLVDITSVDDDTKGYEELPQNEIDRSDRKLLAAAVVARAKIINALDTDWFEKREFLNEINIEVYQLCAEHGCRIA